MFNLIANAAAAAPAAAHDAGMSLMPASMCVKEEGQNPYGLVPALCEGGIVSQVTFLVLLIMFVGTLYILFTKLFERSEEHTSELQSLMRISYAVFCLKKKNKNTT